MSLCEIFYAKQLLRKSQRPRRAPRRRTPQPSRPMLFEPLEPRLLLAATPLPVDMATLPALAHEVTVRVIDDAGTATVEIIDGSDQVLESRALVDTSDVAITGDAAQDDTVIIDDSARPLSISFAAGGGSDTLVGPNAESTWTLTGAGEGTIGPGISFTGVENLVGGSADDQFIVEAGGSVSGLIDGGDDIEADSILSAGAGPLDGLNFQNIESIGIAVTLPDGASLVQITQHAETTQNGGVIFDVAIDGTTTTYGTTTDGITSLTVVGNTGDNTFELLTPIEVELIIDGGAGLDAILGADTDTQWTLDGPGAGRTNGDLLTFSGIERIVGGAEDDNFILLPGGSLASLIDGGGGETDSLVGPDGTETVTIANTWRVT